ncbi:hypothetical protein G3O08_03160 [Cryomorpha ignava]|uniref:Tetratricopeptide repeat protein n=1 Tax=Cryomorpha ignava TaxID=101383 RepID=A0A7K3WNC0_9FLAO|nr:hypothetical protein [Cryomorpha ignava]NEN22501.1 hypothetical protein [Cryomorpha ignava]
MTRFISLISTILLFASTAMYGQDKFAELSSKERITIAENEEKEASNDEKFQSLMQDGHLFFKDKHYLKAVHSYEQAQERRPYNVYPKVIIADIELSMKDTLQTLRAAEKAETQKEKLEKSEKPAEVKDEQKPENPKPESEKERREKQEKWEDQERAKLERQRELDKKRENEKPAETQMTGDVEKLSTEDFKKDLGQKYPDGITEEMTTEGNKTIIKRIVVSNNVGNEYKKVVHGWGGVFYFKNGEAVTDRVWIQETEK